MVLTLGLSKDYLKYIDEIKKNEDDTYTISFVNDEIESFKKTGIKRSVINYIEAKKEKLEIALNTKEVTTEIALKQDTAIALKKETQSFIEENIEDLKAMLMEYRLTKGTGKFDSYIKLDIPEFVKNIPVDTVLSVKGNKETYKKFKNFAELHGVSVGTLFNYLIYSLLSSFNAW